MILGMKYISQEFNYFYMQADELTKRNTAFINYLNSSTNKVQKFKNRI
jgi:hypothetical protein